jgi:NADH-quinone oxidoreductase subunit H
MGLESVIGFFTSIEWSDALVQGIASVVKFLIFFVLLLHIPPVMVWVERRAPALMQRRRGPNRVGIGRLFGLIGPWRLYGLLQSAADAVKLIWKEEVVPDGANKSFYHLAPIFAVVPAFLVAMAIPYGPDLSLFGYVIPLSVISVDVGFLYIFAVSSLGVYGITIAGWASNNKYSLLGAMRASAQMISYEIPLGMSLIPIVIIHGTLDLNQIVISQGANVWNWGIFTAPVSFVIFFICMFAETNRAPFDLAEGESELVAGFHTEFNSAKFAAIFLAEYVVMFVLACLASVVFLGGWQIPFVSQEFLTGLLGDYSWIAVILGHVALMLKAAFFMWMYVWVRWTLPRFRYDQLMALGWKFLLPIGLVNIIGTAAVIAFYSF